MERSRWETVLVYFGLKEDTGPPPDPQRRWVRLLMVAGIVAVYVGLVARWGWDLFVIGFFTVALLYAGERLQRLRRR